MQLHKRYLLLIEFNEIGYIIDSSDRLSDAEIAMKEVFNNQHHYLNEENIVQRDAETKLLSYKVHPTGRFFINYQPTGCSNGFFSAYIFDTHSVSKFSVKQFCFERASTIYAFDLNEYDPDNSSFLKEAVAFIAN